MTQVIHLGPTTEKKKLKPIEFVKCIDDERVRNTGFIPRSFDIIYVLPFKQGLYHVFQVVDSAGNSFLYLGHLNDGVV